MIDKLQEKNLIQRATPPPPNNNKTKNKSTKKATPKNL